MKVEELRRSNITMKETSGPRLRVATYNLHGCVGWTGNGPKRELPR